jgi:Uma2 family endonuclease
MALDPDPHALPNEARREAREQREEREAQQENKSAAPAPPPPARREIAHLALALREELDSDEPEMESDKHLRQLILLMASIAWAYRDRKDYYAAGNMTVYYKLEQLTKPSLRGPDFFVVLGVSPRMRKSWTVWQEGGRYPNIIVELLSESTRGADRGPKKEIYQNVFRTPEYFLFDPETLKLEGFILRAGAYMPIEADAGGRLPSEQLGLSLGVKGSDLRFFTADGAVVPTEAEAEKQRANAEKQRADAEKQRADAEKQRADRAETERKLLEEKLRSLGISPS